MIGQSKIQNLKGLGGFDGGAGAGGQSDHVNGEG